MIADDGVRSALVPTDLEPSRVYIIWRHWSGALYDLAGAFPMEPVPDSFYYRYTWPPNIASDLQNVQYVIRARRPPDNDPNWYNMSFWPPMEERPHAWCIVPEGYDYPWTSALEP